jgi:hypothetical protein
MKKIFYVSVLLITVFGFLQGFSQSIPTYPIPSYNIRVIDNANFQENYRDCNSDKKREKREVNVHIRSAISDPNCQATVWVYSLDQTTVLGPFTVDCGETLTVAIDDGEWGVLVESDEEIIVDVWFSAGGNNSVGERTIPQNNIQIDYEAIIPKQTCF